MAPLVGSRKPRIGDTHTLKATQAAAVAAEIGPVTAV